MKHGRRDKNHSAIREGLRACGYDVEDTADLGSGFPDLVVGAYGSTLLFEIKSSDGAESDGQREKRTRWKGGPWVVVRSLDDALRAVWVQRATKRKERP